MAPEFEISAKQAGQLANYLRTIDSSRFDGKHHAELTLRGDTIVAFNVDEKPVALRIDRDEKNRVLLCDLRFAEELEEAGIVNSENNQSPEAK